MFHQLNSKIKDDNLQSGGDPDELPETVCADILWFLNPPAAAAAGRVAGLRPTCWTRRLVWLHPDMSRL